MCPIPHELISISLAEAKSSEATQSLLALSMMYRRLSEPDMMPVRKAAVYHRLIPVEDMAQYNTGWKTKAHREFPM